MLLNSAIKRHTPAYVTRGRAAVATGGLVLAAALGSTAAVAAGAHGDGGLFAARAASSISDIVHHRPVGEIAAGGAAVVAAKAVTGQGGVVGQGTTGLTGQGAAPSKGEVVAAKATVARQAAGAPGQDAVNKHPLQAHNAPREKKRRHGPTGDHLARSASWVTPVTGNALDLRPV